MAEEKEDSKVKPFLEVICKGSGKIRRFSVGTEAKYAANSINEKLIDDNGGMNGLLASRIEAVKEGEEPVIFGPNSLLVDYGPGWKLQTVIGSKGGNDYRPAARVEKVGKASANDIVDSNPTMRISSPLSSMYIGKIVFAFFLIFVFGAVFTLALENLPRFILYINSSL